jgi:hypothetical protein
MMRQRTALEQLSVYKTMAYDVFFDDFILRFT